jgi:hypothetical protein
MKKLTLFSFVLGLSLVLASSAGAVNEPGLVPAPENLQCSIEGDQVCFDWDDVEEAVKYSVDVDVEVDTDGDGVGDVTVPFSFGTSEYNEEDMGLSELCVPLDVFVFDLDGDGILDVISGPATAKVKGLAPGKGNGRQNNLFSPGYEFTLL